MTEKEMLLALKTALGAHLRADAYRDTFPDDKQDADYLLRQETWWRLKARQWISRFPELEKECLRLSAVCGLSEEASNELRERHTKEKAPDPPKDPL